MKLCSWCVALAVAAGMAWYAGSRSSDPAIASPVQGASMPTRPAAPASAEVVTMPGARVAVAPGGVSAGANAPVVDSLVGHCTDPRGAGIAGAVVELFAGTDREACAGAAAHVVRTGADGRFALQLPSRGAWTVELGRGTHAVVRREAVENVGGGVVELGRIVLVEGRTVVCRVSDASGRPLAARAVRLSRTTFAEPATCRAADVTAVTGADGTCSLAHVLPGSFSAQVAGEVLDGSRDVVVTAGDGLELVHLSTLDPSATWRIGGVVAAADGRPAAGATVVARRDAGVIARAVAGTDGGFVLAGSPGLATVTVAAWAPGHDVLEVARVGANTDGVELQLERGSDLILDVAEADGSAAADFVATLRRRDGVRLPEGSLGDRPRLLAAVEGEPIRVTGLPRGEYELWVRANRGARIVPELQRVHVTRGVERVTVRLPRFATRGVTIVDSEGAPVPGCSVEVCSARDAAIAADTPAFEFSGVPAPRSSAVCLLVDRAVTDERGTVELVGPVGLPVTLRVLGASCQPSVEPMEWQAGELRLVVRRLDFRFALAIEPADAVRAMLAAWPSASLALVPASKADRAGSLARALAQPIAAPRPPGFASTEPVVEPVVLTPAGRARLPALRVDGGGPVRVDLAAVHPAVLRGAVTVDGVPASYGAVRIVRLPDPPPAVLVAAGAAVVSLDGAGTFEAVLLPGRYRVFALHGASTAGDLLCKTPFELAPGDTRQMQFAVAHGRVHLTFRDAGGAPIVGADTIQLLRSDDRSLAWSMSPTDSDGAVHGPRCEAGDFVVRLLPKRLGTAADRAAYRRTASHPAALESEFLDVARVTVHPGTTTRVDVVVPAAWGR